MNFKKYILHVETSWCGEENDYAIIKDEDSDIDHLCEMWAWENFESFEGMEAILSQMFPEVEGDYTEDQQAEAEAEESSYYSWTLEEFDEEGDAEWNWYELILDESNGVV